MRLTRVYVRTPLPEAGEFSLEDDVVNHLVRVMRLQDGHTFVAFDGSGVEVLASLRTERKGRVAWGTVLERRFPEVEMKRQLTLYLAVVKGERFDWAVEKATELGVSRIVPLITEFTAVRPTGKERCERWQRLAESASCQSGRVCVPEVAAPLTFAEALQACAGEKAAIFVPESDPWREDLLDDCAPWSLFIGPEGGFSEAEVEQACEAGLLRVGLGQRILRVETAALAALCLFGALRS